MLFGIAFLAAATAAVAARFVVEDEEEVIEETKEIRQRIDDIQAQLDRIEAALRSSPAYAAAVGRASSRRLRREPKETGSARRGEARRA